MISQQEIEKIFELDRLAKEDGEKYAKRRFLYPKIKKMLQMKIFIGIAGLRGMGKTIILRQLRAEIENSLYMSADAISPPQDLFELAKDLQNRHGIKCLLIDEIHYQPNWQQALKKIFDFLPIKIVFTSSASIDIIRSKYDLSRRVAVVLLPPFSLREYVNFKKGADEQALGLDEILKNHREIYKRLNAYEPDFSEFCQFGALPAYLQSPQPQTISNILQKATERDLQAIAKLDAQEIIHIKNILRFVSRSNVEVCSYSSVAKNVGITRYKAQEYIELLKAASILKVIEPYGTNVSREPKIICTLPLRAHLAEGAEPERLKGAMREEFFVQHIMVENPQINYLKGVRGEKKPDYMLFHNGKKLIFEIGGHGKGGEQLKGINAASRFILSQPGNIQTGIPLILFGFLY